MSKPMIPITCPNCQHTWDRKQTPIEKVYNAGVNTTKKQALFYLYPYCWLCGEKFSSMDEATIEHIRPIVAGGADELANLTLTHSRCNSIKGSYYTFTPSFVNKIRGFNKLSKPNKD